MHDAAAWPVLQALPEPQWLNCDVRTFDMSTLGKFGVIMTDPPWEIHQVSAFPVCHQPPPGWTLPLA